MQMTNTDPQLTPPPTRPVIDRRMTWALRFMLIVAVAGVLWVVFSAARNPAVPGGLERFRNGTLSALEAIPDPPPQPVEAFTAPDGSQTTLASYRGKVILVNYWATWCPPCVKEMPTLAALDAAFAGRGFDVVAISVDRADDADMARQELARLTSSQLSFYHDPTMQTVYPARARGFPTSILYDRQGREVARLAGEADWNAEEARALVAAVLEEAP
jgi:thiol-disulfide isomerase/thioredoxin